MIQPRISGTAGVAGSAEPAVGSLADDPLRVLLERVPGKEEDADEQHAPGDCAEEQAISVEPREIHPRRASLSDR
jgi:hypothetical protein